MDTSLFLLKFWGWYFVIFFFILSFNPSRIKQIIEDLKDQKFTILISFITIVVGLLNILAHNIWEPSIELLVTLFGWSALLKGILLFTFPKQMIRLITYANIQLIQVLYILLFLVGMFLLNAAYNIVLY
jgi:hypothetical protein